MRFIRLSFYFVYLKCGYGNPRLEDPNKILKCFFPENIEYPRTCTPFLNHEIYMYLHVKDFTVC